MKNIAIILAGGSSNRLQSEIPKQYLLLNGKDSLLRSAIQVFRNHPAITDVICVIRSQDQDIYQQVTEGLNLLPPAFCGRERQQSVYNALSALREYSPDYVLIHDAARPLIEEHTISAVIDKLQEYDAVDVGIELSDTIKRKDDFSILERDQLYATQTPQGFKYQLISSLHQQYADQQVTDDISLAIKHGKKIGLVKGDKCNFKITTADDYLLAKQIVRSTLWPKVGYGFDIHAFTLFKDDSIGLMMGGIRVPFGREFIAHSDGDVVLHALTDALLGAIGEEDIGMHFPPSDLRWKNMDSVHFLEFALSKIEERRGVISNIDINIVAEKPKLMEYKPLMRKKIAEMLKIKDTQVSVKAKTSERLGFVGREEGISVSCVCMLLLPEH